MTVPTGPASLLNIQTEFGGSNPIKLSEYYAGGGLVPTPAPTSSNQIGAIPTSGRISIGNFLGTKQNFVYNSECDDLSTWTQSVNGGGGNNFKSVTQISVTGLGSPALTSTIFRFQSDVDVPFVHRVVPITSYNHVQLDYYTMITPAVEPSTDITCMIGANGGAGEGIRLTSSAIQHVSYSSYASNSPTIISTLFNSFGGAIDNIWFRFQINGTRLSSTSFSITVTVTKMSTNTVILSTTFTMNNVTVDELLFKYHSEQDSDGERGNLDYVHLTLY